MGPKDADRFASEQSAIEVRPAGDSLAGLALHPQPAVLALGTVVSHDKKLIFLDVKFSFLASKKPRPGGGVDKQLSTASQGRKPGSVGNLRVESAWLVFGFVLCVRPFCGHVVNEIGRASCRERV